MKLTRESNGDVVCEAENTADVEFLRSMVLDFADQTKYEIQFMSPYSRPGRPGKMIICRVNK